MSYKTIVCDCGSNGFKIMLGKETYSVLLECIKCGCTKIYNIK